MSNKLLVQDIGKRIRARRESIGMSQSDIAQKADISLRSLSALESTGDEKKGKTKAKSINPTIDTLNRLCSALQCNMSYLLGFSEYYTQEQEKIVNQLGLSPAAADILVRLTTDLHSNIPAIRRHAKQYLDLVSDALCNTKMRWIVPYYSDKIREIDLYKMSEEEARIFDSKANELDYYCYALAKELQSFLLNHYLPNGIAEMEEDSQNQAFPYYYDYLPDQPGEMEE